MLIISIAAKPGKSVPKIGGLGQRMGCFVVNILQRLFALSIH
jgi:hypothetical protein